MTSSNSGSKGRGLSLGPVIVLFAGLTTFVVSAFVRLFREITVPLTILLWIWGVAWAIYAGVKYHGGAPKA